MANTIQKSLKSKRESKRVDFKESMDVASDADWCELIKDVIAIANSGGGAILIGIKNDGSISRWDPSAFLKFDPAKIVDKLAKYIGIQFEQFDVTTIKRNGALIAVLNIGEAELPLVFVNPGTYEFEGRQKTAFGRGTLFFRHGAKSEPAKHEDLVRAVDKVVEHRRKIWFKGIRQVIQAKPGDTVQVIKSPQVGQSQIARGRITSDKNATAVHPDEADSLWPHRQADVVKKVNAILNSTSRISSYDLLVIRKQYKIDQKHPEFFYKPFLRGSPQYSEAYVNWLIAEHKKDPSFFRKARLNYSSKPK